MVSLETLKRKRGSVRASLSKGIQDIEEQLAKDVPSLATIRAKLARLEATNTKLLDYNERIMDKLVEDEDNTQDVINSEQEECDKYSDKWYAINDAVNSIVQPQRLPTPTPSEAGSASTKRQYKLPMIKIKEFNGDLKEWLGFWAQFQKIHDDEELHNSDKFQYLMQAMTEGSRAKELVTSYPQSGENYPLVVTALRERFGRPKLLKQVYVRELLKMVISRAKSAEKTTLSSLYDKLESHLRALESLGVTRDQTAEFLYPMVESSLPEDILIAWQRSALYGRDGAQDVPPKTELDFLMLFLRQEVESEEQRALARNGFSEPVKFKEKFAPKHKKQHEPCGETRVATAAGLFTASKTMCIFCDKPHDSKECGKAMDMSLSQKKDKVKQKKACFSCLRTGHGSNNCKVFVKCLKCKSKHVTLMCPDLHTSEHMTTEPSTSQPTNVTSNFAGSSTVYLESIRVTLQNGNKKIEVRALFDPAAQRSYVSPRVLKFLNLEYVGSEYIQHTVFGGERTAAETLHQYRVQVKNQFGEGLSSFIALEKNGICGRVPKLPHGPWMSQLKKNKIWISDMSGPEDEIELLIGANIYGKLLTGKVHQLQQGLTAIQTKLGWVVMGEPRLSGNTNENSIAMSVISMFVAEASPQDLWSLETIGIKDPAERMSAAEKDQAVREHFLNTVTRKEDGRYSVRLPWTDGVQDIPTNKKIAISRLNSTTSKLESCGKMEDYNKIFVAWEDEGIVEEVQNGETVPSVPCHYVPHRAVFKPESKTTPIRPVFDASCKTGRSPSLNDCLAKGPNLLEVIPSILHRFRERRIGVVSDIRKAFQMIDLHEDDRDYLRFLWWESTDQKILKTFRHSRVVFGVNCSPFLLGAVLEHHLMSYSDERAEVAQLLWKSLYVDNCVLSVDSFEEYEEFKQVSTKLLSDAKMDLRQWECSTGEISGITSLISREGGLEVGSACATDDITTVLGYKWNKYEDTLQCDVGNQLKELPDKLTRRTLLSHVQKVFDPLGFLSPAMLVPKLILQKAWKEVDTTKPFGKKNETWDLELSEDLKKEFIRWYKQSHLLGGIRIPRHVSGSFPNKQLHIFCDASQLAYAAVVFLRVETDDGVRVQLLQAKSRVAPMKCITIPRLELLGCSIAARLASSVYDALSYREIPSVYWSDSTTALAWIRRNDEWGTFVGNRVKEILKLSDASLWRHVPGLLNPADLPSRGCSPEELLRSRWWEGPEWLKLPATEWPVQDYEVDEDQVSKERKKTLTVMTTTMEVPWYAKQFSSYSSTVRMVAWIYRFFNNCKKQGTSGELSCEELNKAEKSIFKMVQAECFSDKKSGTISGIQAEEKDGLLCVKTRLLNRVDTTDFKHPVILPSSHPLSEKLIREVHLQNKHAGAQFLLSKLREKVWILQGRRAIKRMTGKCVVCRKFSLKAPTVPEAPLPSDRIKNSRVFQVTGVDLAGPLFLKNNSKAWIVIFTCAYVRAIHLELVTSLSTDAFLLAFHRFISRRGRPEKMYSDNGTNFVGAVNLFQQLDWKKIERESNVNRIQWVFNPPSAAWWGGWWERLIRSVKGLLKRSLGRASLDEIQMQTCLCEVEAIINGRPLTHVTEDTLDLIPLTPAMFLQDIQETDFPEEKALSANGLRKKYHQLMRIREGLFTRFRSEYLSHLIHRGKQRHPVEFAVGDMVWISADNKKRQEWPLGRIIEMYPGSDGQVHSSKELPDLEKKESQQELLDECSEAEVRTRSGRIIKKPKWF